MTRHFFPNEQVDGTCGFVAYAFLVQCLTQLAALGPLQAHELKFDVRDATSMDTVRLLSRLLGPDRIVSASATRTDWLGSREMLQIYESEHVQGELRKATAKCGSECNVHLLAPMSGYKSCERGCSGQCQPPSSSL